MLVHHWLRDERHHLTRYPVSSAILTLRRRVSSSQVSAGVPHTLRQLQMTPSPLCHPFDTDYQCSTLKILSTLKLLRTQCSVEDLKSPLQLLLVLSQHLLFHAFQHISSVNLALLFFHLHIPFANYHKNVSQKLNIIFDQPALRVLSMLMETLMQSSLLQTIPQHEPLGFPPHS